MTRWGVRVRSGIGGYEFEGMFMVSCDVPPKPCGEYPIREFTSKEDAQQFLDTMYCGHNWEVAEIIDQISN